MIFLIKKIHQTRAKYKNSSNIIRIAFCLYKGINENDYNDGDVCLLQYRNDRIELIVRGCSYWEYDFNYDKTKDLELEIFKHIKHFQFVSDDVLIRY